MIRYRYQGPSTHLYAHLRAGSAGWAGAGAGAGAEAGAEVSSWPLRLVMYPGPELGVITDLMESAVDSAATHPERTRADVWLALLRLAALDRDRRRESGRLSPGQEHLTRALAHIERHLSEPLTVPRSPRRWGCPTTT